MLAGAISKAEAIESSVLENTNVFEYTKAFHKQHADLWMKIESLYLQWKGTSGKVKTSWKTFLAQKESLRIREFIEDIDGDGNKEIVAQYDANDYYFSGAIILKRNKGKLVNIWEIGPWYSFSDTVVDVKDVLGEKGKQILLFRQANDRAGASSSLAILKLYGYSIKEVGLFELGGDQYSNPREYVAFLPNGTISISSDRLEKGGKGSQIKRRLYQWHIKKQVFLLQESSPNTDSYFYSNAKTSPYSLSRYLNNQGYELYKQNRFQEATEYFIKSIAIDSKYLIARTNLASTLSLSGKVEAALQQLKEAYILDADFTLRKMKKDKDYDNCRNHPEFKKLIK